MLLPLFTSYPPRALGAPATYHCVHRTPIRPELAKADGQRLILCAATFHFLLSAREGRSLFLDP